MGNMIDYGKFLDFSEMYNKSILIASFYLDKNIVLDTLKHNSILICGKEYKTPKNDLIDLLRDDVLPCLVELQLEEI